MNPDLSHSLPASPGSPSGIKSWPEGERPRERLITAGAAALSDAELIAVLLRTGTPGKDAVHWAREVLSRTQGFHGLFALRPQELVCFEGIGWAKACCLSAANEIARRHLREKIIGRNLIQTPEAVLDYLTASLRHKKREVVKVLFLDQGNGILDETDLFEGTVDESAVYPREILKAALEKHASALILVHNHPSGRREPSAADRKMTQKLEQACRSLSIRLLDHIIIAGNDYFSFHEAGLLGKPPE